MNIVIVGGGVAGLAAAVACVERGHQVTVLESRSFFGGRAYSFTEPVTQQSIDNGQHLFMGCYRDTFHYLEKIGSRNLVDVHARFQVPFAMADGARVSLDCPSLPPPWHLVAGLWRFHGFAKRDLWQLVKRMRHLRKMNGEAYAALDQLSVAEWLDQLGQGQEARDLLWTPLTLAIMNELPERASAAPMAMILREGTMSRGVPLGLGVPRTGLSALLVKPAVDYLTQHGARVEMSTPVTALDIDEQGVTTVYTRRGQEYPADVFILALPPRDLYRLMHASGVSDDAPWSSLPAWQSVPILSVHMWYDRPVMTDQFLGMVGGDFHWAFNKTPHHNRPLPSEERAARIEDASGVRGSQHCVSLVSSAARELVKQSREAIVAKATAEVGKYLLAARVAHVTHTQVTKELHATVSVAKGSAAVRLPTRTPWANTMLAGDWTQTYLPATIEGAVRSGYAAAKLLS